MKLRVLFTLLFCQYSIFFGQTSLKDINLENGKYKVGFRHYVAHDSTRTYTRIFDYNNEKIARPIPISIWYPSDNDVNVSEAMTILEYLEILKEEEEWEHLPNEQILNWFYYPNTPENQTHLKERTTSYLQTPFASKKFPVIVYAPSYQASSIENFALCEYLASHGYVVVSSPSRGTETRQFSANNVKEMETQSRDVEFVMNEVSKYPVCNMNKIATMGFSFGGLSNTIAAMRNENIKAVVSLDGTERYQYQLLQKSPFFNLDKFNVPYMHMAQKRIPEQVLKENKINPELNTKFELFDSISKSSGYKLRFHNLTHPHFSALGVLFHKRDKRQDKNDKEIMGSYKWLSVYTLNFLNAYLKNNQKALKFVDNNPMDNGLSERLVDQIKKNPEPKVFTFKDFNEKAYKQDYKNLFELYQETKQKNPDLELPERELNTLGLQFVFNKKRSTQGINVFLLATKLYPNSANLFDSLAEGYLFMGEKEKARESFEKSLELNAQNQNAIFRLQQLNK
ncbi:prolyl oligopeptidase family serine peptidase [Aquimarina sp. D1M17]|uniref:CocE/NonD family hydrolase n=1 Tax=Aquimarina acroporae TaxID=2937283 RepID=UPI0020BFE301|nr:CocE/NonD family hydrolase [Aquimarina acroporae]MCK8522996.1 prolyl oligopeptidase family serine peptidase [Aquimarina acroporae]